MVGGVEGEGRRRPIDARTDRLILESQNRRFLTLRARSGARNTSAAEYNSPAAPAADMGDGCRLEHVTQESTAPLFRSAITFAAGR